MTGLPASARDQLSQMNPGFILPGASQDAGPAWVPVIALLADAPNAGYLLDEAVSLVARRLQTTESWIAASILFEGWAARLTSLYAGTIILGTIVPDLSATRVEFRVGSSGRVQLTAADLVPVDIATGWHRLYDGHLDLVAQALRRRVRIGRQFLDSAVAAALAGSLTTAARAAPGSLDILITQPWAQPPQVRPHGRWMADPSGLRYLRDTCCGYQRVPDGGPCRSCPLNGRGRWRAGPG
jgi:iron complex transport system ATP-binding protein